MNIRLRVGFLLAYAELTRGRRGKKIGRARIVTADDGTGTW